MDNLYQSEALEAKRVGYFTDLREVGGEEVDVLWAMRRAESVYGSQIRVHRGMEAGKWLARFEEGTTRLGA